MSKKQFVISAHVVRQLGEQLISDEVTALIELVKNSYDADARRVTIVVDTHSIYTAKKLAVATTSGTPSPGYISIRDTGTGMDDDDIEKGWLRISFSSKRGSVKAGVVTPRYKRSLLGSKGVGRLSAQRLGSSLDLFSLKEYYVKATPTEPEHWIRATQGVHLGVDWDSFREDIALQTVPVFDEVWLPESKKSGTELIITNLYNTKVWEDENSRRELVSTLAQLISPFAPAKSFGITININNDLIDLYELSKQVRNTAISTFKFSFDNKELIITGKVKLSLFRGGNAAEDAEHYQLLAQDKGQDFFRYLEHTNAVPNMKPGEEGWFFEFVVTRQADSLGLLNRPLDSLPEEETKLLGDPAEQVDSTSILPEPRMEVVSPGPFHGEIDQLAYENSEVDTKGDVFTDTGGYKAYVKRQAGVRVYRDGFGIRPYGLDGDDWMGFQAGTTSGRSFYGLRPKNLIGYVELTAKDNEALEEKTDREGFVLNDASNNFFTLIYQVRTEINNVLTKVRRRFNEYKQQEYAKVAHVASPTEVIRQLRGTTQQVAQLREQAQRARVDVVKESITQKLRDVQASPLLTSGNDAGLEQLLREARDELNRSQEINAAVRELQIKLDRLAPSAEYLESQITHFSDQLRDFSELAGLGLTAEALTHEISNIVDRLSDEAKLAADFLHEQKITEPKLLLFVEQVRTSLHALRRQTQHLDDSLHYVREKREVVELSTFIQKLKSFYESRIRFQDAGISLPIEEVNSAGFNIFCNRGDLTQIFDNLVLNSEYWLKEAGRQGKVYAPQIFIALDKPFIRLHDNGIGVDPGIVSQLFMEPFLTTKPNNTGRGLGLFISKQLLEKMGAFITLLPDLNRFGRPYIFQLDFTASLHGKTSTTAGK